MKPKGDSNRAPLLSVCIPTYNRAAMLVDAIESALTQGFEDFELIVCDNASTDDTEAVVKRYRDPRLRYCRFPELVGMYANHNRCIELARAPWIIFLHSDDRLAPSALSRFERAAATASARTGILAPTHDRHWVRKLRERPWCGEVVHWFAVCNGLRGRSAERGKRF
jgi:glycosyltransferase involved in cell wall biosynthesis